jgi:uncharacterized protein
MAGTFEIYEEKAGEFRFRLKDTNGQVIVTVGGYKTKASAIEGIESVQKNAPGAKIVSRLDAGPDFPTPTPDGPSGPMPKGSTTSSHAADMAAGSGMAGTMTGPGWDDD